MKLGYIRRATVLIILPFQVLAWIPIAIVFPLLTDATFGWCASELYHHTMAAWQQGNPFPNANIYKEES